MLTLRGLTLTAAAPRIIVPLFARSLDALRPLAAAAQADPAAALVRSLTDKPLIVTIRTRAEGGELALTPDAYAACCRALLACGGVDVLDIEWRACGPHRDALRSAARAAGAAALFSEHHFDGTPATEAMTAALTGMPGGGGDGQALPRAVESIVAAQQELQAQINLCGATRREVVAALDQVTDARDHEILRRRYLLGQRFEEIAVEMCLEYRWVRRRHKRAVSDLPI